MIPFLSTQLERGAGASAHEVRPVVPSLFEPMLPVADTMTDEGRESVGRPVSLDRVPSASPLEGHAPSRITNETDLTGRFAKTDSTLTREGSVRTGSVDVPHPELSVPQPQPMQPPVSPQRTSPMARPVDHFRRSDHPSVPSGSDTAPRLHPEVRPRFPEAHDESQRVQSLAEEIARLSRRLETITPPTSPDPAIRVVAAQISSSPLAGSFGRGSSSNPAVVVDRPGPTGLVPQQAVPQIELPPTPAPAPTVTVSIGRIEFRHSARRSDPAPSPAPSLQRATSRVLSLDDYLHQRAAGAP